MSSLFHKIENSDTEDVIKLDDKSGFKLGLQQIPEIFIDNTDRNRTSPFAFTGNRFEFRAVGSAANCGGAITVLNTAMAQQLKEFYAKVEKLTATGVALHKAVFMVIKELVIESKPIVFDGNGYSEEWKEEAAERGLDCESSVPLIFDRYLYPETFEMFETMGVMNRRELEARAEVNWEMYTKKIQIEARVLGDLIMNHILPVASAYEADLLDKVYKINQLFTNPEEAKYVGERDMLLIMKITSHIRNVRLHVDKMVAARRAANVITSEREKAIAYHDNVAPEIEEVRYYVDKLELIVDNERWTLPKYRELLFLR